MKDAAFGNAHAMLRPVTIWLIVLLGFAISLALLYPGHYSYDSGYQYWQARTGEFSNITPVAMIGLWALLLDIFGNPASLLCLNLGMFWAGLGLCFVSRALPSGLVFFALMICGLSPLVLMQMGHLLSDAHMAALLVLATGLLASYRSSGMRSKLWVAGVLIVYAGCIRQNALVAVIPLGAVAASMLTASHLPRTRLIVVGGIATAILSIAAGSAFDRALVVERRPLWPMLAIWDLAAVSVATDDLLLPAFTHGSGLSVEELRETNAFDPISAGLLFTRSRSGINSGLAQAYTPAQQKELAAAWWSGLRDHPREYLAHRLRTTAMLIGRHDDRTAGLAYYPTRTNFSDNPALPAIWNPLAHKELLDLSARLRSSWLFSALPYLLTHFTMLAVAIRRRRDPRAAIVIGVTSSALAYAASFVILAPSVELRFLTWPIVAAPLVIALWFAPVNAQIRDERPVNQSKAGRALPVL